MAFFVDSFQALGQKAGELKKNLKGIFPQGVSQ